MSSNHTPGPWALETVSTSVGSCHKIGVFPGPGDHKPTTSACVYADYIRIGTGDDKTPRAVELLANARLIAAAPELLDALSEMLYGDDPLSAREKAEATIAKAIGAKA